MWAIPAALGRRLEELWERLPPWTGVRPPTPPPLGYRGCRLEAPDGRMWTAYGEQVASGLERRRDADREFEGSLIGSAPPGFLPPDLQRPAAG